MIDEGAANTFFADKRSWDDSKLFLEGQGYVTEAKHQHPEKRWQDVPIIVTSNTLPYVLCDDVKEKDMKVHRFAFRQRIAFSHLTKSYENTDIFPYDTRDLAAYMWNKMKEIRAEMAEDEFLKIEAHKESLQSSIRKPEQREFQIDIKDDQSSFITPVKKQQPSYHPPIVFGNYLSQSLLQKRVKKQLFKANPFAKKRAPSPNNNALDFKDIMHHAAFGMRLRSNKKQDGQLDEELKEAEDDGTPPGRPPQRISFSPALNLKSEYEDY